MAQQRIHFIGGGQMAEAIIRALVGSGTVPAHLISAADVREERVRYLSETYRIQAAEEPKQALAEAELIVIAVRPQDDLAGVGGLIREFAGKDGVVVSIVAGVTIAKLESYVGSKRSVVRVIPNTLTDTGFGYSGVAFNEHAELAQVEAFLNGFGKVQVVDEAQLDVLPVTAWPDRIMFIISSNPLPMRGCSPDCRGNRPGGSLWRTSKARWRCCGIPGCIRASFSTSTIPRRGGH